MYRGVCSYSPKPFAANKDNWQNCANPMMLGGCTRHMECLENEFCMDCSLCLDFQAGVNDNTEGDAAPMCGACVGDWDVSSNPTSVDFNGVGRNYNSATSVSATCAPKRPFQVMWTTALDAFGL